MDSDVVVIFGASGGIGSVLGKQLSEQGKCVVLCSRNEEKLKLLAQDLKQPYLVCDGCSEEDVRRTIDRIFLEHGRINGVANCIGSIFIKPLHLTTMESWSEVIRVNLTSCFCILKASLEKMAQQQQGSIVLISSCAAQIGMPHHEAIAAAKGAVEALIRAAAASYAKKGIRVNGIAPGLTLTPLAEQVISNETALKTSISFHPLGRLGKPEDIASAIVWLLSQQSSWITGQVLSVDGGLTQIK